VTGHRQTARKMYSFCTALLPSCAGQSQEKTPDLSSSESCTIPAYSTGNGHCCTSEQQSSTCSIAPASTQHQHVLCCGVQVRVVCPGVFAASIALAARGSLEPVRVCVDSADKAVSINAWASSKHQVGQAACRTRVCRLSCGLMHGPYQAPGGPSCSQDMLCT
jgi:hypothetical protein